MRPNQKAVVTVGGVPLLAIVVGIFAAQPPRTAGALYQEALLKKDGEGDLDGAIKLFTKILTDFPKERKVAGLAQLQIGMCYEKLGLAKAEEAYRKVVADFGDQPEAVKAARDRLSALAGTRGEPAGESGLVLRKLDMHEGKISPDGRYVARESENLDSVVIYDIENGKERNLTFPPTDDGTCCYMVYGWTPSSKRILVSGLVRPSLGTKLFLVDLDGHNIQLVIRMDTLVLMGVGGFSLDEKSLYVLVRSQDWGFHAIGRISMDVGKYAEILNLGQVRARSLGISPDGERLAITTPHSPASVDWDIQILSSDGRDIRPLVSGPSADQFLGWMPDGRGILFSSTRTGEQGIWALPVTRGQASGDPVFVRGLKGFIGVSGFRKDGAFFYTETLLGQDVYVASVDFDSGKCVSEPVKVESIYAGRTRNPFWAPDGKSLAYIFATAQEFVDPYCRHILKIRSISTGKTKDILLDFKPARYVFASGWTSDGTAVIMRGESNGKNGLWQVDVSSGESKLIYESSRVVAWSADGNVVYENSPYTGNMAKREDRIVRKDQRAGLEKEIFRGKPGELLGWMSVSPDGKLFGIMINDMMSAERMTSYAMIPEGGGQEVVRIQNPAWAGGWSPLFFWAPQNKGGAVVLLRSGEYEKSELWFYPQGSNAPERRLEFGDKVVWGEMTFSPDGKFLAFASDIKNESTFWSVENYLPAKK